MKTRSYWFSFLLAGIVIIGTYVAIQTKTSTEQNNQHLIQATLTGQLNTISSDILLGLEKYQYGLRSLLAAIETAEFENFNYKKQLAYFNSRDYPTEFPGTRGFGLIKYVEKSQLKTFLQTAANDRQGPFELKQLDEPNEQLFIIQYIEPEKDNQAAIGLDIGSEKNRRMAALQAAMTGKPQLTGPITLVQAEQGRKHGFLLLLAVYQQVPDAEQKKLVGWVYTPLLISEILDAVLAKTNQVQITISDTTNDRAIDFYSSSSLSEPSNELALEYQSQNISSVFGRNWQVTITPTGKFIDSLPQQNANHKFWSVLGLTFLTALGFYLLRVFSSSRLQKLRQRADFANVVEKTNLVLSQKISEATDQLSKELNFKQSIIESDNSAIIAFNKSGLISLLNNSAINLLGFCAAEAVGKLNIVRLMDPSCLKQIFTDEPVTADMFEMEMKQAQSNNKIPAICLLLRKNGESVKVKMTITRLLDSNGFVLIAQDLSEKQDLENNIALINAAINNTKELLLWVNIDGSICKANPYAYQRLNYSETALTNLNISDLVDFKAAISWEAVVSEVIKKQQYTFEVSFRNAKGEWLLKLVSACQIKVESQQFIYLTATDITQRIKDENELKAALNRAETANKAKTEFITNMSHELRTPLNSANGFLQLLQLTQIDDIQQKHITQTKIAISSLTQIVDEILEVTYAEKNQLRFEKSDFVLDELLSEVGLFLYEMAGDKAIEVHFKVSPDTPYVMYGDKNKLKRILLNLGSNAVKFSNKGEVLIELAAQQQGPKHICLQVKVKDSGIGIDKNKLSYIFEMFTQANNAANRQYGGLGIGLTIASQYINFLGGSIEASSELNKGSEFRFTVLMQPAVQPKNTKLSFTSESPIKVLLVDDNQTSLSILSATIIQLGWQLKTANSAKDALSLFQSALKDNCPFDLALLDWKMPDIDGWALSELIRKKAPLEQMPLLIMITAHSKEILVQNHQKNPKLLNGFLTKPITRAQLINAFYDAVATTKQASIKQALNINDKPLLKMRVLVVEDNPTNQDIVKQLLESQGASTTISHSGLDALFELENSLLPFDVVLMDIQMPGIDGYETTKRIRENAKFTQLPILAMTANVMPSDKERCFAAGMNGHIGKPFELSHVVKQILLITNKFDHLYNSNQNEAQIHPQQSASLTDFCKEAKIDIHQAMQRFNHLERLYLKSLALFRADLQSYILQLEDDNSTYDHLKLIFHTLKSTAAALGFTELSKQAKSRDIKLEDDGIEKFDIKKYIGFAEVCRTNLLTLSRMMELLQGGLSEHVQEADADVFLATYKQLKTEVENFNMHAIDSFQKISGSLKSVSTELANELTTALNKLKFKTATEILVRFDALIDKE
jgi:PAS domain S-box-containing protein